MTDTETAPAAEPAVLVSGLRKVYGGRAVVDGVDLRIDHGEIFALLGPNGAGKTTTVEILEGYRRRDGGEVSVLGTDPAQAGRAWRAEIGIVPQTGPAAAELSVREMVRQFSTFYPDSRDPDEVIEAVGLAGQASTRLRKLSGGQRRRVDVAVGIVGRPRILFLDEPTTGFDPQARRQFWDLIRGLASDGTTILLTTHYLEEAAELAGRVAVLAGGRIVALGRPADLGQRSDEATVSWIAPGGIKSAVTSAPTDFVKNLAAQTGGEIPGLTVTRPSLEDRYLALIAEADLAEAGREQAGAHR